MNRCVIGAARLALAGFVAIAATAPAARANGTTHILSRDGSVRDYARVRFALANHALHLTSSDGKGSLAISLVDCVKLGDLHRCRPGGAEYRENGEARALRIADGTLYFNPTPEKHALSNSSTDVPPYGVIMTVHTARGTYISATARLDGMQR
jgi:hypothetical protein